MSDLHVLIGGYAVDALDADERATVEQHLSECADCRQEFAEFIETLAELSRLSATAPPSELRGAILGTIRELPQQPPVTPADAPPAPVSVQPSAPTQSPAPTQPPAPPQPSASGPTASTDAGGGSRSGSPVSQVPAPEPGERAAEPPVTPGGADELSVQRARRRSRWLLAAVAAALVAVLGIGGFAVTLRQQVQQQQAQAAAEAELLSAPDAQVYAGTVQGQPVSFVVSRSQNKALFVASELPSPGAGKTYQLWTIPPDADPVPDAMVPGGTQRQFLTGEVSDAAALAVSIENAGGALTPTTDQIQLITPLA